MNEPGRRGSLRGLRIKRRESVGDDGLLHDGNGQDGQMRDGAESAGSTRRIVSLRVRVQQVNAAGDQDEQDAQPRENASRPGHRTAGRDAGCAGLRHL